MPKHGLDQLCIIRTPLSILGTSGGPSWAHALVSPRMSLINKCPSPHTILKNTIIRGMYDASARHLMVYAIPYIESTATAWTRPKMITKIVLLPFRLQILKTTVLRFIFYFAQFMKTL